MDSSEHAFQKTRDQVSLLSSSVRVPHIRHTHQEKIALLCVELFHALFDYDGIDNPLFLFAIRDRRAHGCWYNRAVVVKYYTAYLVRFTSAHVRSAADRGILRAHYAKHFYVACFLVYCSYVIPPVSIPITPLGQAFRMPLGLQTPSIAQWMESN